MNDIDRSVESLDFAFRRRFAWKEMSWDFSANDILISMAGNPLYKGINLSEAHAKLKSLNNKIKKDLGSAYCLGGSFLEKLFKISKKDPYKELWDNYIENVIKEYLRGTENTDVKPYKEAFLGKAKSSSESEE